MNDVAKLRATFERNLERLNAEIRESGEARTKEVEGLEGRMMRKEESSHLSLEQNTAVQVSPPCLDQEVPRETDQDIHLRTRAVTILHA